MEVPSSDEQSLQLTILEEEKLKLQYIREMSGKLASSFEEQTKLRDQLKTESKDLQEHSERLVEQQEQLWWEEYECSKNFQKDTVKLNNVTDQLKHYSYLLGYTPSLDYEMKVVTLYYKEDCFIKLHIDNPHDLLEISPKHPSFEAIKKNLYKTKDITGLIATLRKFFDFVMNIKNS